MKNAVTVSVCACVYALSLGEQEWAEDWTEYRGKRRENNRMIEEVWERVSVDWFDYKDAIESRGSEPLHFLELRSLSQAVILHTLLLPPPPHFLLLFPPLPAPSFLFPLPSTPLSLFTIFSTSLAQFCLMNKKRSRGRCRKSDYFTKAKNYVNVIKNSGSQMSSVHVIGIINTFYSIQVLYANLRRASNLC